MKAKTLLLLALLGANFADAQYYYTPHVRAGQNPGNLNTDVEYPVGGGLPAGWTTVLPANATPVWSNGLPIPFAFQFDGSPVTHFKVSNSGCVTFDTATSVAAPSFTAVAIPSATVPNKSAMVLGIRGITANSDNVITKTFGTAPNRQFWIQFSSYSNANANDYLYYSIVLEETTNRIQIVDQRTSGTASTTIGVQVNATTAVQVSGSPNLGSQSTGNPDPSDNSYYTFTRGSQPAFDLENTAITTSAYQTAGNVTISGTVTNLGTAAITSFDVVYQIGSGSPVTATISGVNIPNLGTYTYSSSAPWNATVGTSIVRTWTKNLNGSNADANPSNDTASKALNVLSQLVQRKPLYEIFTSSTCPPCNPGNANFHAIVDSMNKDNYVAIKFQQDFPGTGDPYTTNETVNRRNYYAINSIPRMELDGGWDGNANSFTLDLHRERRAEPAQYILNGTYDVDSIAHTVTAKVKYAPLFNTSGSKMYVAIIENMTVKNVRSNGETKFFQVNKKLLPSEAGQTMTTRAVDTYDSMSYTYTFPGNYRLPNDGQSANRINLATENTVEHYSNLRVVAWIQGQDKKVYQAANLYSPRGFNGVKEMAQAVQEVKLFPNPASDLLRVKVNMTSADNATVVMFGTNGTVAAYQEQKLQAGDNEILINTANLANGIYTISVIDSRNNSNTQQAVIAH